MSDDPVTGRRAVPTTGEHKAVRPPSGRLLAWDVPVVAVALALLAAGWWIRARRPARVTSPATAVFRAHGLTLSYPAAMAAKDQSAAPGSLPLRVSIFAPDAPTAAGVARETPAAILVEIDHRGPVPDSITAGIEGGRLRYGPSYQRLDTGVRTIAGRELTRVRFRYTATIADQPHGWIWGTEYTWPPDLTTGAAATYTVTVFGSEARTDDLEASVLSSIRIDPAR